MNASRRSRPLPPLKPENALASARVLVEAGLDTSALRQFGMDESHIAQVEAAMDTARGGAA